MLNHNYDMNSVRGTALTLLASVISMTDIEQMSKIMVMAIGIVSGITTIVYNIKKIKKDEKR